MDKFTLFILAQLPILIAFATICGLVCVIFTLANNRFDDKDYAAKKELTIYAVVSVIVTFITVIWWHFSVHTMYDVYLTVLFIITTPAAMWTSYRLWHSEEHRSWRKKMVYVIFDIITIIIMVAVETTIAIVLW